jgi:FKBP-type peptidyl-prolyl cis-trans isomerase
MKKLTIFAAVAFAALISSCSSSTPKADLKTDIDSLSYTFGMANTEGLMPYLSERMGVDTTEQYMKEFIKGLQEGVNAGDDKKKAAYYAGIQIGQQISQQMIKGLNHEIFGEDSTKTISLKNFLAGFISGTTHKGELMKMEDAQTYLRTKMEAIQSKNMEQQYGPNKKACEAYMANIAKKPGIKSLGKGVYYEVVTEGKGAVPSDTSKVKVNYEGKTIDGKVFDSSYTKNEPTMFRCNQVIPGWTLAVTHMPVGSKWIVYIPQEMGYGSREAGQIKPFSALIFTVELLSIEK